MDGRRIVELEIATRWGDVAVRADGFIDASGDAAVAWHAGLPVRDVAEVTGFPAGAFAPQRWQSLATNGSAPSVHPHFGFGHGPRYCPGRSLGLLDVGLVVGVGPGAAG